MTNSNSTEKTKPNPIGISADHGGFELKQFLTEKLRAAGHEVVDFGDRELKPNDDYPDFVVALAHAVAGGRVERGVAICGSGVGATVAANKVAGVRACLIHENFSAHQGVEDDDLNLICLGGLVVGLGVSADISRRAFQRRGTASPPSGKNSGTRKLASKGNAVKISSLPGPPEYWRIERWRDDLKEILMKELIS